LGVSSFIGLCYLFGQQLSISFYERFNEMKKSRNLPIYVLSVALVVIGIISASQAQAAWTSKETSRVKTLEAKVQQLEKQLNLLELSNTKVQQLEKLLASQELITIRYLATSGGTGFVKDICPGVENLENLPSYMATGRLMPRTDLFGREVTDIYGKSETPSVYACRIQVYAKKGN